MHMTRRGLMASAGALGLWPTAGRTQAAWPDRPVRFIVPFAPGGPVEVPARFLADALTRTLGQPVLVETKPGAGGLIGVQTIMQANDPHTLLFTTSAVAIVPALLENPGYDPIRDLVPISMISEAPMVVLARPDNPIRNLAGLIARAKANPGSVTYGSSGVGTTTHLAGALLGVRAGLDLLHIPYRGTNQSVTALYAGDTDLAVTGTIEALRHVKSGRLTAIALTGPERSSVLPDTPTVGEEVPGYALTIWYGLLGPASTPPDVVARIAREIAPLAQGTTLANQMQETGARLLLDGPERLKQRLAADVPLFREVVQKAGIRT